MNWAYQYCELTKLISGGMQPTSCHGCPKLFVKWEIQNENVEYVFDGMFVHQVDQAQPKTQDVDQIFWPHE